VAKAAQPDPYAILGVSRSATRRQVARAHRRLAKRFHPDLHAGAETAERMRLVNEAWLILSSADRRAAYDRDHPIDGVSVGVPAAHWAPSRQPFRPAQPTTTRTWASWRASAAETRMAPATRRAPDEEPMPAYRRPARLSPAQRTFRDSGWAALLVAGLLVGILVLTVFFGRMATGF